MRIKLVFQLMQDNVVPFNRKSQISNWLLNGLNRFLTNEKDSVPSRNIRFVFSDLFIPRPWNFDPNRGIYSLTRKANLKVSIIINGQKDVDIDLNALKKALNQEPLRFDETICQVINVLPIYKNVTEQSHKNVVFEAISPVVAYVKKHGREWYLKPSEQEFYEELESDLIEKYQTYVNSEEQPNVTIQADFESTRTRKIAHAILLDNDKLVRGYKINFSIKGPEEAVDLAYCCGLGKKNEYGFGMLELAK